MDSQNRNNRASLTNLSHVHCRTPVLPDSELKKLIKVENYVTDRPITFYTEKMQDGTYYASKANNDQNAFNRNNEFVSTFSNYKNRVK